MKRTVLITGAASGIGQATAQRCCLPGDRVITVDLHDAEIEVDLGTPHGRRRMIEQADTLAPEGLDAVLAAAGIAGVNRAECVVSVNYFGAVATLEGLLPLMTRRRGARAAAIASTAGMQLGDEAIVEACLGGDERGARNAAKATPEIVYHASKRALTLWLRRAAVTSSWAEAGTPICSGRTSASTAAPTRSCDPIRSHLT